MRRGDQRRQARDALETARRIFARSGARGLVSDCDRELAKVSGRSASGISDLTQSEREVARLVATGMRNIDVARSLHLSPKTVETHLGHVYRKLGIANRTELSTRLATSTPEPTA